MIRSLIADSAFWQELVCTQCFSVSPEGSLECSACWSEDLVDARLAKALLEAVEQEETGEME